MSSPTVGIVPQQSPEVTYLRSIAAQDRKTGRTVHLVQSASRPNLFHLVQADRCDCRGFQATGRCRHLRQVRTERNPLIDGGAAHLAVKRMAGEWTSAPKPTQAERAAEYRAIFGSDDDR